MAKSRVNVKRITKADTRKYDYVRPNPGVHTIAAINGRGAYKKAQSAKKQMSGLSASQRRASAQRAVRQAIEGAETSPQLRSNSMRRVIRRRALRRNAPHNVKGGKMRWADTKRVKISVPVSRTKGTNARRKVSFRVPKTTKKTDILKEVKMAKNRRRKVAKKATRRVVRKNTVRRNASSKRRVAAKKTARKSPVRKTATKRKVAAKRKSAPKRRSTAKRRVVRKNARKTARKSTARKVVRRKSSAKRRSAPKRKVAKRKVSRKVRRNASKRAITRRGKSKIARRYRRNSGLLASVKTWAKTGSLIASGVIGHKLLSGFLKNMLVSNTPDAGASAATDAAVENGASGLGILPEGLVKHADVIASGLSAGLGIYLAVKTLKKSEERQLVAGGIAASFIHTLVVKLLKNNDSTKKYAESISGLGATAASMSAMYGVGASIEPMYQNIGTGEYFSSGVGEYFSSGVGEYFSSGVNGLGAIQSYEAAAGLGEYGANSDVYQAAAGYGALESNNSHHIDPSSDLDRELSIAEAAAGVGSAPMQAAAGLGNVGLVRSSSTWIPGESDPDIWAGVRPVNQPQSVHELAAAGTLTSGGSQGIFG